MLKYLVQISLQNRLLVLAAAAALCVLGAISAAGLPIDVLPDLDRPTVAILTEAPGLAPEEVETQVTFPIESAVGGAPGVQCVRSTSGIGLSIVHVEFDWGSSVLVNRQVMQERLSAVQEQMPEVAGSRVVPRMGPVSSIMGEVMLMGVTSDTLSSMDQRSAADWIIRPALLSIPGIAQVTVQGGDARQFQVKADPDRLRLYELTLADLERAVAAANQSSGGGFIVSNHSEMIVRNVGRVRNVADIENALVVTRQAEGHSVPVRVRDVARVVEGPALNKRGEASMAGRPAVVLAIAKQPGADTRAITRAIDERIAQISPGLPPALIVNTNLFRQAHFINSAIGNVLEALRDGSILVVIVIAIFLLNIRATLIVLTAIPLSMLTTFIVFRLLGESINTMTLGGIAVAVGELVDDAVVGVENVVRRDRENRARPDPLPTIRVVFDATCEVRGPILIGTAIVLLVFLPLLVLPGLPGRLFTPLAAAYILSIAASMLVSLTVTPVLASFLLTRRSRPGSAGPGRAGDGPVLRVCKAAAAWAYSVTMPRPFAIVSACLVLVLAAAWAVTRMGTEFLPPFNEGTAVVSVNAAPGVSLAESDRTGRLAERLVLEIPEVKSVARRTGRAEQDEHALGVNASELEVDFFKKGERASPAASGPSGLGPPRTPPAVIRSRSEVFTDLRNRLETIPGVAVSIGQPIGHRIDHLESGVQAQIVLKIFGPDFNVLQGLAGAARAAMDGLPGVADLQVEQQTLVPQVRIRIDPERAARFGFTVGELADTLQTAVGGKVVSQVLDGLRAYDLVVILDDPWRSGSADDAPGRSPDPISSIRQLREVRLLSPGGAVALVSDVADIQEHLAPNQVARENGQRRIVVSCNVGGRADLGTTAEAVRASLAQDIKLPQGYSLSLEGQFQSQQRATRLIAILSLLALAAMFALLAAHFRSAVMALQVMLNVPFAFIGAVAALLIAREPFSVASLIGFISLCGIAARNGVLMISHYIHVMTVEDRPFSRDTIIRASQERVAPVLMTALTTGLAMLPLLVAREAPGKEILYPVALVVFGGLVTSTLLDFFVTPTVFLRFCRAAAERLVVRHRAGPTDARPSAEAFTPATGSHA